jgi:hypothetical protein
MALAGPSDIGSWIGKDIDPSKQAELTATIAFAQAWIAQDAGLRSLEKESSAVTTYLDGSDAGGGSTALWLPADLRPVWHSGSDLMVVAAEGTTLTLSVGYSITADVVLSNVNTSRRVCLHKRGGWLTSGPQNVAVTCKVGWHLDTGVLVATPEIRRLIMEVAWLMFNSHAWVGKQSISKGGSSISIENDLSPGSRSTLDSLRGV